MSDTSKTSEANAYAALIAANQKVLQVEQSDDPEVLLYHALVTILRAVDANMFHEMLLEALRDYPEIFGENSVYAAMFAKLAPARRQTRSAPITVNRVTP